MKTLPMVMLLFLCFIVNSNAANTPTPITETYNNEYTIGSIFFEDSEQEILFVDFGDIQDELSTIRILKGKKILFFDDVTAIPSNSIYEIELSDYKGKLTIEVTTQSGLIIQKVLKK